MQTIQNTALHIVTGCTRDAITQHLPYEINALPMGIHLKLSATQLEQLTQTQTHSLRQCF